MACGLRAPITRRAGLLLAAVCLAGCRPTPSGGLGMPGDAPERIVPFTIAAKASSEAELQRWHCEYPGRTGKAVFDLLLEVRAARPGEQYAFTRGSLVAQEGSHTEELMAALARAHHSLRVPQRAPRGASVSFVTAILGQALSRGKGKDVLAGEFTSSPAGPWIVVKLFLEPQDAELYLALDPIGKQGLFLSKDDEYWDDLEPVLSSVL